MTLNQSTTIEQQLQQIAEMLLVNGLFTDCPGLIHGKTGIAIFFFHYGRYTDNELFEDYAFDLVDSIQQQIHNNSPADYKAGISGIGVGMDYLLTNQFISADDDIYNDFDERIYRAVMYDPRLDCLYDGLTGYGRYWMMRLNRQPSSVTARECLLRIATYVEENVSKIMAKEQSDVYDFLQNLCRIPSFEIFSHVLKQCQLLNFQTSDFSRFGNSAVSEIARNHQHNPMQKDETIQFLQLDLEKEPVNMGILSGYAGEGMLRLAALNPINQWILFL